jgi:hypothetical protein
MKGLSSMERVIVETIARNKLTYEEIHQQSGLMEHVCFNVLQSLIMRGVIRTDGIKYQQNESISPLLNEELNSQESKIAEALELIESVVEQKVNRLFRFQKVALEPRDEKIFLAMLSNLESFLIVSHKKSHSSIPVKSRKIIFWGMGDVQNALNYMIGGE